jgi:hypothetical protein
MTKPKSTTETLAAFARRLGVDKGYVSRLRSDGRLVMTPDGKVDVEASLARLEKTRDPRRDDVRARHAAARDAKRTTPAPAAKVSPPDTAPAHAPAPAAAPPEPPAPAGGGNSAEVFRAARVSKMHYEARRAVVRVARIQGRLAETATLRALAANDGATVRSMLENLADQAAPRFAPVREAAAAARILEELLGDVTETMVKLLARNIEAMRNAVMEGAA